MESITNEQACDVGTTLDVMGGKWKILIIYHLFASHTPMRFSALRKSITGITEKMLSAQLRNLESNGLVNRKIYPVIPPHVEYSLTPLGQSLRPILLSMKEWGASFNGQEEHTSVVVLAARPDSN